MFYGSDIEGVLRYLDVMEYARYELQNFRKDSLKNKNNRL